MLDSLLGTFVEEDLGSTSRVKGPVSTSGHSIVYYCIQDDYGRFNDLRIPINYSKEWKFSLIYPR